MSPKSILAALLLLVTALGAQTAAPLTSSVLPPDHPNFNTWRDRRFGMFIHWGPVSIKGTEIGWSRAGERRDRKETITGGVPAAEYDSLYKRFNPVKFNADEWAAVAKAAGMKYIVLIAKHHDGFCMFDSALTEYKITNSPFQRDITAELAAACKKAGLGFGLYYSPPDWHHPDFFTENHARYIQYLHGQMREILTKYGPIDVVWFDRTGGVNDAETWGNPALFKMIRELQPQAVITTRCGGGPHGGNWGDFDTPEQMIGGFHMERSWETCMTICKQWAWKPNDTMKSLKECMDALIRTSGGDGNLLFNVGPMPSGEIEARQVVRLKEMGAWLANNGEAIYGTRGGPWKPSSHIVSTRKGNKIYIHLLRKMSGPVKLPALPVAVRSSRILNGPTIETSWKDNTLSLEIPSGSWDDIDTIVELTIDGDSMAIPPLPAATQPNIPGARATASAIHGDDPQYAADMVLDGDPETRWATPEDSKQSWLQIDFAKETTFCGIQIEEALAGHSSRVKKLELQKKSGDIWETFHSGATLGAHFKSTFKPVTTSAIRLNIPDASKGPTISEVLLIQQP